MKKMNVLVLGSYPCVEPRHGGQIRLAEILNAYRRAGFDVQSLNIYDQDCGSSQVNAALDFHFPRDTPFRQWRGRSVPLIDDLNAGRYAAGDEAAYARITAAVDQETRIIHLEQPWHYPLVKRWRSEGLFKNARLVYGSQNIEAPLKRAILDQYQVAEVDAVVEEIAALEKEVAQSADLRLAVSESDRLELAKLSDKPVVLAANGIAAWHAESVQLNEWRKKLPQQAFALFVGSAHPPNIFGFLDTLGDALGFLPPGMKIVIAGGVGEHIVESPTFQRWLPLNQSRCQTLGILEEEALAAVKTLAHLILLPITEGGGSNIKTAEALYSGKYVIGTPVSFRGFGEFLELPGVFSLQNPPEFRAKIAEVLAMAPLQEDMPSHELRQKLLWEKTLQPMLDAVAACVCDPQQEISQ